MPLTPDQHPPDQGKHRIFEIFVFVNPDNTVDVKALIEGSIEVTVAKDCDINKVSQRTGGDPVDNPGVTSSKPVDAPIEDHSTGDPARRPPGEQEPPNMTGGGKPIRGGGTPGGVTPNPKGDDDSDGVKNRNDRFPNDPTRS